MTVDCHQLQVPRKAALVQGSWTLFYTLRSVSGIEHGFANPISTRKLVSGKPALAIGYQTLVITLRVSVWEE